MNRSLTRSVKLLLPCALAAVTIFNTPARGEDKPAPAPSAPAVTLPDDADKAWAEVQAALMDIRQKAQSGDQNEIAKLVGPLGDKAMAFAAKFPKHANASQARQLAVQGLAMSADADPSREAVLEKYLDKTIADATIPDDDRVQMYMMKHVQLGLMKKIRSNPAAAITAQAEMQKLMAEKLVEAQKQFPKSNSVYAQLLGIARNAPGDEAKKLAQIIVTSEHASKDMKATAQDILDGKRPFELGKPLDIKFTAVDGREVDLSKMKGKVVLIDFWATWCGPCVAELPHVKETYAKLHDKGFEIVAISFDNEKDALVNFVKEKDMPWPQYFDGKGWGNAYGVKYGIQGIPTMWLVGKDGNLADLNGRGNLEEKVTKLLEAKTTADQK